MANTKAIATKLALYWASKISSSTKHDVVAEILLEFIGRSTGYPVNLEKTNVNGRISKIELMPLNEVSSQRQKEAIEIVTANSRTMMQEQPDKLVKLRNDIDLVVYSDPS